MNLPEELVLENGTFVSSELRKERKRWVRQKSKQVVNEKYPIIAIYIQEMGKKGGGKPKETNTKL